MLFWNIVLLIGILAMLGATYFWFRCRVNDDEISLVLMMTGLILAVLSLIIPQIISVEFEQQEGSHVLWSCDAPFGRYWVEESGTVIFACGSFDSTLVESYTLKYLVGDELKTMILSSTASNVHLHLTTNVTMHLEIWQTYDDPDVGPLRKTGSPEYHIYVPDPHLFTEGGV